jgi:uridylate kinase
MPKATPNKSDKTYKRVLLKISGESMMGDRESGISNDASLEVAKKIKAVKDMGIEVAVVIGGGNIFRGLSASKSGFDRATADYMGMLATVMNGLALQDALNKVGVDNRVQSALTMPDVAEPFIRNKAIRHLEKDRVVILTAGIGSPYVTTDTGATLRALELHCDVVIKATKVDGVYNKDPFKHSDAKRYRTITYQDAILMPEVQVMDTSGLSMAMENGMRILVLEMFKDDNLLQACRGEDVGTLVSSEVETQLAD